jgi:thiol-disulfide isomerase/thioredoxin
MHLRISLPLALLIALMLGACGAAPQANPPAPAPTADAMAEPTADAMAEPTADAMAEPTADAMAEPTADAMAEPTADAMAEPTADVMAEPTADVMAEPTADAMADTMVEKPAWQTVALTDARTGATFTLGDFAGRTVFVEPMATWCSKCREQMGTLREVQAQLGSDEFVFIALSVETNISSADLAQYADAQGFGWTFAVLTPEALGELVETFGRTISNPPATPHFIIRPDGSATELSTGIEPADALIAKLRAAQGE